MSNVPSVSPPPAYPTSDPSRNSFGTLSEKSPHKAIEETIDKLDCQLRQLSLRIHDHPEIMFHETYARDLLSTFMRDHGFKVTTGYLGLPTAWRAEYTQGQGGRVVGINSEMDALSGLGHACGHNLIAVSGCGVAVALKAALEQTNTPGKIILLGTPAEESGGGKILLLERGGFEEMDFCLMCHPAPGPSHSFDLGSSNAMQTFEVEFFGQSAHAGASPWEGTNALDAAFVAYSSISLLRQQMRPDHRVHGIVSGKDWVPNVIPDYSKMRWIVRAPTWPELEVFVKRVQNCFQAAALATSCKVNIKSEAPYFDLNQNDALAGAFSSVMTERYGMSASSNGTSASTDFGNVSYEIPSLHPLFAIPTSPNGGNHTPAFEKAAATSEAHAAAMRITCGLANIAFLGLKDDEFYSQVRFFISCSPESFLFYSRKSPLDSTFLNLDKDFVPSFSKKSELKGETLFAPVTKCEF
ncbi:hypothetical protein K435DRAFT_647027 [Dendrothele bispora CBS 962.96]|uniref:Peptidase M20 dimerisation domain-containing protein n=1 Tax=Dendrothele bispora (strain CBS 962.96) TaxID=1314807 RepID=A0A4S8MR30_DENBC|nr:hypothetical protein K435DRAFT_647027 [Dendrothele bispora CBS 962.96]